VKHPPLWIILEILAELETQNIEIQSLSFSLNLENRNEQENLFVFKINNDK